jgi:hypothetical protein
VCTALRAFVKRRVRLFAREASFAPLRALRRFGAGRFFAMRLARSNAARFFDFLPLLARRLRRRLAAMSSPVSCCMMSM